MGQKMNKFSKLPYLFPLATLSLMILTNLANIVSIIVWAGWLWDCFPFIMSHEDFIRYSVKFIWWKMSFNHKILDIKCYQSLRYKVQQTNHTLSKKSNNQAALGIKNWLFTFWNSVRIVTILPKTLNHRSNRSF
jgi:hypothetical protein